MIYRNLVNLIGGTTADIVYKCRKLSFAVCSNSVRNQNKVLIEVQNILKQDSNLVMTVTNKWRPAALKRWFKKLTEGEMTCTTTAHAQNNPSIHHSHVNHTSLWCRVSVFHAVFHSHSFYFAVFLDRAEILLIEFPTSCGCFTLKAYKEKESLEGF